MSGNEIGDRFGPDSDDRRVLFFTGAEHDAGKSRAGVFVDGFAVRGFGLGVEGETGFEQSVLFRRRKDEVINPFEEISAGFITHAVGQTAGERILGQKRRDMAAQESFGVIGKRPVKLCWAHADGLNC